MLEGGADIRYVAELLGHARLETTQIYTRVSIDKLTEVHARTHPSARQNLNCWAGWSQPGRRLGS